MIKIMGMLSWQLVEKLTSMLLIFFVSVKMANFYGSDLYGQYTFLLSVVALTAIFQELISKKVVIKEFIDGRQLSIIMVSFFSKTVLYLIIFIPTLLVVFVFWDSSGYVLLLAICINEMVKVLMFPYEVYCESKLKFHILSKVNIFFSCCLFCVQFYCVYVGLGIEFVVYVSIIIGLLRACMMPFFLRLDGDSLKLHYEFSKLVLFDIVSKSKYLSISFIYYITYSEMDKVMIGIFGGVSDVAIYSIANQYILALCVFIPIIQKTIFPILASKKNELKKVFVNYNGIITWVYIFLIPVSIFGANLIIKNFYISDYWSAITVFNVLTVGVLFVANGSLRVSYLTIENKTKILMYVALIGTFLNIFLNILLIHFVGFLGAAIATVITQAITSSFVYLFFSGYKKIFFMQLKSLFFWRYWK